VTESADAVPEVFLQQNLPAGFGPHWLTGLCLQPNGEVVTFYSYKGGTGRSMALVNCAGLIAQQLPLTAKPLLLIDFDLEAPGLHRYLGSPSTTSHGHRNGVLELFADLSQAINREAATGDERLADEAVVALVDAIALDEFIRPTSIANVKLMVAGNFDRDYGRRLTQFDWEALHRRAPALFRSLAERFARDYCLTFVDSRTGLSDTTGICTTLLPDALVMVFTPNQQSLTGIEHLVRSAVEYRQLASDTRPLRVYPLPSRVDNQVESFRQIWRHGAIEHDLFGDVSGYQPIFRDIFQSCLGMKDDAARSRLGEYFDVVQVPHSADYAYGERLCFTNASPSDSLSVRRAYEQFLPWLVTRAEPWQRPFDVHIEHQALAWLHSVDARSALVEEQWEAWFDHLADGVQALSSVAKSQLSGTTTHGFDVCMSIALGCAHRELLATSTAFLSTALDRFDDEQEVIFPVRAPAALLVLQHESLSPRELSFADRRVWIQALDRVVRQWQPLTNQRIHWLNSLLKLQFKAEWWTDAYLAATELSALTNKTLGAEHDEALRAKSWLASVEFHLGNFVSASEIKEQVLDARVRQFGPQAPETLAAQHSLASTLLEVGRFAEAREHAQIVLNTMRQLFGDAHPETIDAQLSLARALQASGDLDEACRHLSDALDLILRKGGETMVSAKVRGELGKTLYKKADFEAAREHLYIALSTLETQLGRAHPDTLPVLWYLSFVLFDEGLWPESIAIKREVLEHLVHQLGDDHSVVSDHRLDLARALRVVGDFQAARLEQEMVLGTLQRLLGDDHTRVFEERLGLAATLKKINDPAAVIQYEEALNGMERVLGHNHPRILAAQLNWSVLQYESKDFVRARALQEDVLTTLRDIVGDDDPETLRARACLAKTFSALGELERALDERRKVWNGRREKLGTKNFESILARHELAATLYDLGRLEDALYHQVEVASDCKESLGNSDPNTLAAQQSIIGTLAALGDLDRAIELQRELLDSFQSVQVPAPYVAVARQYLAKLLLENGEEVEALASLRQALPALFKAFGVGAERTLNCAFDLARLALSQNDPSTAAEALDSLTDQSGKLENPDWLGLRTQAARLLGDNERLRNLRRQQFQQPATDPSTTDRQGGDPRSGYKAPQRA
jgi:tetratricopeptide (TPR) repeat protein/cellulose biosynthesis protein BcsQ